MSAEKHTAQDESRSFARAEQLRIPLNPQRPYGQEYLVVHSGIAQAVRVLEEMIFGKAVPAVQMSLVYLYGPVGCGKTHLVQSFSEKAIAAGWPQTQVFVREWKAVAESEVSEFVALYEAGKREGALILCTGPMAPRELSDNPHLVSRLQSGHVLGLDYPKESELRPLLLSLLERRNLQLSERNLEYLVSRLPRNPLSFAEIFSHIDRLCLSAGRSVGLGVIRQAMSNSL